MGRQAVVRVLADPVVSFPALPIRVYVNRKAAEVREVMKQLMTDLSGDFVPFADRDAARNRHADFGVEVVTDPPRSNIGDLLDTGHVSSGVNNLIQHPRLNTVKHPKQHRPSRLPNEDEDRR